MLEFKDLDSSLVKKDHHGAERTATEIFGQPELWKEVYELVLSKKDDLNEFLSPILAIDDLRIILTGAGSSAFIGESVEGIVQDEMQKVTNAIATTDLVTHPELFFLKDVPTLLISFARSGNSPESLETINLANEHCRTIYHLIITCNREGAVASANNTTNRFIFLLPETANDKSLVMTGSFTSMLLVITLISKLKRIGETESSLFNLIGCVNNLFRNFLPAVSAVATSSYDRVVFLGSGPMLGIARECHLKLQELTDGKVICKHDSFLGFRHGPKVVANENSLIVYLFSNDDFVFQYERDLAVAIAAEQLLVQTISYGRKIDNLKGSVLDIKLIGNEIEGDEFYFIAAGVLGQLLGFYKAISLGLQPDNPSVSGRINRVVQGVTIYSKKH